MTRPQMKMAPLFVSKIWRPIDMQREIAEVYFESGLPAVEAELMRMMEGR